MTRDNFDHFTFDSGLVNRNQCATSRIDQN